jgi:hypothetical protein
MTFVYRVVMIGIYLLVPTIFVYVWHVVPQRRWYAGYLSPRLGLIVPDSVLTAIEQFNESLHDVAISSRGNHLR